MGGLGFPLAAGLDLVVNSARQSIVVGALITLAFLDELVVDEGVEI